MKYDPQTKKNTVLMEGLFGANGILLSPNEDFLLVAESGHSRIHQYFLKGANKGGSKIFVDGLPGVPDNLRLVSEDRFFAPLVKVHEHLSEFQYLTNYPLTREFLTKFLSIIDALFNKIETVYPNKISKAGLHFVGHLETLLWISPVKTTLLEFNWSGDVVRSYHGSDGSFPHLSDVFIHNGYLYMGSPYNNFLGRIPLTKLGEKLPVKLPTRSDNVRSTQSAHGSVTEQHPPTTTKQPHRPAVRQPPPPTVTQSPPPAAKQHPAPGTKQTPPPNSKQPSATATKQSAAPARQTVPSTTTKPPQTTTVKPNVKPNTETPRKKQTNP